MSGPAAGSIQARHVIFDFFGTLVTYREGIEGNPVEHAQMELVTHGIELPPGVLVSRFGECFTVLERAANESLREYAMADAVALLFERLGVATSPERVARFVDAYLRDWTQSVRGLPGLGEWLGALPASKSVLSNTHHEPMLAGLMNRLDIDASFARVTTSIGHGYRKPHPSIYLAHLDSLGISAQDAIFVGDNLQCDYAGPRAIGIEAFLIAAEPVDGVDERHRLTNLYELTERLSA